MIPDLAIQVSSAAAVIISKRRLQEHSSGHRGSLTCSSASPRRLIVQWWYWDWEPVEHILIAWCCRFFLPMINSSSAVLEQHLWSVQRFYTILSLGQKSSMFLSVVTISTITRTLSFQAEMHHILLCSCFPLCKLCCTSIFPEKHP